MKLAVKDLLVITPSGIQSNDFWQTKDSLQIY